MRSSFVFDSRAGRLSLAGLACVALLAAGCDSDSDGTSPGDTSEQQLQEGLGELASFGIDALGSDAAEVMLNPAVSQLMTDVGLALPDLGGLGALSTPGDAAFQGAMRRMTRGNMAMPQPRAASVDLVFGTYVRNTNATDGPFVGWQLVAAGDPADGLVFRFNPNINDITYIDADGARKPVAGEVRFLNVVVDDDGGAADPIVTSMTFELAMGPSLASIATVVRIAYEVTLDVNRQPIAFVIGDESDIASTFLGPLSFAFSMSVGSDAIELALRLADASTSPPFVLRLAVAVNGIDAETEIPLDAGFTFGWGATNDLVNPPWEIEALLDTFRSDPSSPGDVIADVQGQITLDDTVLATFAGDTSVVLVDADINGDGVIDDDDTCANVQITFTGARDSQSICELGDLGGIAGGIGLGALATRAHSPWLWVY